MFHIVNSRIHIRLGLGFEARIFHRKDNLLVVIFMETNKEHLSHPMNGLTSSHFQVSTNMEPTYHVLPATYIYIYILYMLQAEHDM